MASTTDRAPLSLTRHKIDAAFGSMAMTFSLPKASLVTLFSTIAAECKTQEDQWLYLQTCKAYGLNPLMKQLYATRRGGQLVLQLSYYVFTSRARQAGYLIKSSPVYAEDKWGGFDAVAGRPVSHTAALVRKNLVGAWACAVPAEGGGECVGAFYPLSELLPPPLWGREDSRWGKTDRSDVWACIQIGAYGPMWSKMPGRMAEKCAVAHVGRRVAPDLEAIYAPEEFGEETPRETPISEMKEAEVVAVSDPTPTAGEQMAAAQTEKQAPPEDAPAAEQESLDECILRLLSVDSDDDRAIIRAVRERIEPGRAKNGSKAPPRTDDEKRALIDALEAARALAAKLDSAQALQAITSGKGPNVVDDIRKFMES